MEAELTAAPAEQEPEREVDDDEPDRALGPVLNCLRKEAVEEDDRKPEGEQRRRVAKAPGEPELAGAGRGALAAARDERRHGGEVIRVARVAEPEQDGDGENDPDGRAAGRGRDSLVETEHRITSAKDEAPSNRRRAR
jgi:hypothetical protein